MRNDLLRQTAAPSQKIFSGEFDSIVKNDFALAPFGKSAFQFLRLPVGCVERGKKCLRMRHQTENPSGGITDSGNVIDRTVRIFRESLCFGTIRRDITQRDEVLGLNTCNNLLVRDKFAFSVANRQAESFDPFRKDAGRFFIGAECYPVITENTGIVMRQRRLLLEIPAVQSRGKSETCQSLKPVADADHELSRLDKCLDILAEPEFQAVCEDRSGTEMIPERKSADKRKDVKLIQFSFPVEQIVQMDLFSSRARGFECGGGLFFAVEPYAGND